MQHQRSIKITYQDWRVEGFRVIIEYLAIQSLHHRSSEGGMKRFQRVHGIVGIVRIVLAEVARKLRELLPAFLVSSATTPRPSFWFAWNWTCIVAAL